MRVSASVRVCPEQVCVEELCSGAHVKAGDYVPFLAAKGMTGV